MRRSLTPVQLILIVCAAEIVSMPGVAAFPALLPTFIETWGLSKTDAGWINGLYYAGYLVAVPVLVSITDRIPPKAVLTVCMILAAFSNLGFALWADGFWTATLFRVLAGVALAGTYMPGLKLLNDHLEDILPGADHSRSVAFYTSSFGIGTAASYFLSGVLATASGWQYAFFAGAAGPVAALAIIFIALPLHSPRPDKAPDTHLFDFRPVLRCRPVMGYVFAYTVHNFELFAYRSWMVAFLFFAASNHDGSAMVISATAWAAIANLMGPPSSVLGNELSRRFGRHRTISVIMVLSAVLGAVIGFSAAMPFWVVVTLLLVYGVLISGESSSVTAGAIGAAPKGYRGATMAVHSCIGFVGSFAGPLMFGVMLDLSSPTGIGGDTVESWGIAFAFTAAVVALGPIGLALLRDKRS